MFFITDGSNFLIRKNGKHQIGTEKESIVFFKNKIVAEKVLNNSVSPKYRKNFYITQKEQTHFRAAEFDISDGVQSYLDYILEFDNILNNINNDKLRVQKEISDIDKEISVIEHYIEFNNFSASEGYKLSHALKVCRINRRKLKNELLLIDKIKSCGYRPEYYQELTSYIKTLKTQSYDINKFEPLVRSNVVRRVERIL